MSWNETFTHHVHADSQLRAPHPASVHSAIVKPQNTLSQEKRHPRKIQYQGELRRWRHGQELLGRKRHSWVLHGLGGSLQPLDRLEERESSSGQQVSAGVCNPTASEAHHHSTQAVLVQCILERRAGH